MLSAKSHGDVETQLISLAALPIGTQARVISINESGAVARRLMEMGVVPGAPVRIIKTAPLGDPVEVRVRNYNLALRRAEIKMISVIPGER
jgi:ferrous iron transport protein A